MGFSVNFSIIQKILKSIYVYFLLVGFPPEKVIFDSPVKTPTELIEALELGLHMNLDNEREVSATQELWIWMNYN